MASLPTRTLRRAVRRLRLAITFQKARRLPPGGRLHVGCGHTRLEGWINVDRFHSPAVDFIIDIRYGLPFRDLDVIYAEHFLEHLSMPEALRFLHECRRALAPQGVLRLTTPNLDWVYATHYTPGAWASDADAVRDCFQLNKAFYAWGHRFIYNWKTLVRVLELSGFASVEPASYGESRRPELRGLERHERSQDGRDLTHILIAEATGIRAAPPGPGDEALADFLNASAAR